MSYLPAPDRIAAAQALGINAQFLYQCLTGRRAMEPKMAVRLERNTNQRVRRWQVRQADWHLIWPELIDTDGAPPIPATQPQEARDAA